jgi:hypothetical protein
MENDIKTTTPRFVGTPLCYNVSINGQDMKALIRIRDYFGEVDKNQLERIAYDVLDRVIKQVE